MENEEYFVIYKKDSQGMAKKHTIPYDPKLEELFKEREARIPELYTNDVVGLFHKQKSLLSGELHKRAQKFWSCSWPTAHKRILSTGLHTENESRQVRYYIPDPTKPSEEDTRTIEKTLADIDTAMAKTATPPEEQEEEKEELDPFDELFSTKV